MSSVLSFYGQMRQTETRILLTSIRDKASICFTLIKILNGLGDVREFYLLVISKLHHEIVYHPKIVYVLYLC